MAPIIRTFILTACLMLFQGHAWANCPETQADKKGNFDQLLEKVRHGDVQAAEAAIGKGLPVDTKNGCGATLLLVSAATGKLELVNYLISAHADVNVQNWEGATPLSAAAMFGKLEVVKTLLQNGANPNLTYSRPEDILGTSLLLAASNNHLDIVKMLLAHGADPCWKDSAGENSDSLIYRNPKVDAPIRDVMDEAAQSKHCGVQ